MGKATAPFERNMLKAKHTAEELMRRGVEITSMQVQQNGMPKLNILPPTLRQVKGDRIEIIGMGDGHKDRFESTVFEGCLLSWRSNPNQEISNAE